jgi:hypothetical protein
MGNLQVPSREQSQDYQKMADAIKQSGAEVMQCRKYPMKKLSRKVVGNLPGYDYVIVYYRKKRRR